jgi:hypothetical protein
MVLVYDNDCAGTSGDITVTQSTVSITQPTVASTTNNYTLCGANSTILLEVTNASVYTAPTYKWFKDNSELNGANTSVYSTTEIGSYHVEVMESGCAGTSAAQAVGGGTGATMPAVDLQSSTGSLTMCTQPASLTLYVNNTQDYPNATYKWFKNNTVIAGETGSSLLVSASGNYFVHIASNSCEITSATNTVQQGTGTGLTTPAITTTSGNTALCGTGSSLVLQLTNAAAYTAPKYQWYNGNTLLDDDTLFYLTVSLAGNYKIVVTENGCQKTSNILTVTQGTGTITVPTLTSSTGNFELCAQPATLTLSVSNTGVYTNPSYTWFKDGNAISGATGSTLIVSESGDYFVHVREGSCESTSAVQSVTQGTGTALPTPAIASTSGNNPVLCGTGSSVLLTLNNSTDYSSSATLQWYKNGQPIANATHLTYTAITAGHYYAAVTDNSCEVQSNAIDVTGGTGSTIPAVQLASSTGSFDLCGSAGVLTLSVSNANIYSNATYVWFKDYIEVQRSTNHTLLITEAGDYFVQVIVGGSEATSQLQHISTSISTGISPTPVIASSSGTVELCGTGSSLLLELTTSYTGATYQWYKDSVLIAGATSRFLTVTEAGHYSIIVSKNGCAAMSNLIDVTTGSNSTVTVPAVVISSNTGDTYLCSTGNTLTLSVDNAATLFAGYSFKWYKDSVLIAGATTSSLVVNAGGHYMVLVYDNDCAGISNEITVTQGTGSVTVPIVASTTNNYTLCGAGSTILLEVTNANVYTAPTYQWFKDNTLISGATTTLLVVTEAGNYYMAVADGSCSAQSQTAAISGTTTGATIAQPLVITEPNTPELCGQGAVVLLSVSNEVDYSTSAQYIWITNNRVVQTSSFPH